MPIPTMPCDICGEDTPNLGTKRCNNCWEIEHRLAEYFRSKKGREFAQQLLGGYE